MVSCMQFKDNIESIISPDFISLVYPNLLSKACDFSLTGTNSLFLVSFYSRTQVMMSMIYLVNTFKW